MRCAVRRTESNTPLSLVVLDLDHFKQVNDRYGHEVGDSVLLHTAQLLKRRLRDSDLPCRLGGEEFAMLLPGATLEQAADSGRRCPCAAGSEPGLQSAGKD